MGMTKEQLAEAEAALEGKKTQEGLNGGAEPTIKNTVVQDIDILLGNGKKIRVFIGVGEDGADEKGIREFHFAPVPIGKLPELISHVNHFQRMLSGSEDEMTLSSEDVTAAAKIAELSTARTDKITEEQIKVWFSFSAITAIVKIAYSINEIEDQIAKVDPTTLAAASDRIRRQLKKKKN